MRCKSYGRALLLSLPLVLSFLLTAKAQVPERLAYQALITEPNGQPIKDGTYRVAFRLYGQEQGGDVLWTEVQELPVSGGLFSTWIGSVTKLELPFDAPYFLTLQVEGQAESERIPLSATPYSLTARNVARGAVVRSVSGLKDDIELVAGDGIEINKEQNRLVISAQAGRDVNRPLSSNPTPEGFQQHDSLVAANISSTEGVIPQGAAGSNTGLDAAYDKGRIITADAGAVEVLGTGGFRVQNSGIGLTSPTFRATNNNTGSGIAGHFVTKGSDATMVLSQNGVGVLLKGFGPNGGNEEFYVHNDGSIALLNPAFQRSVFMTPRGRNDAGDVHLSSAGKEKISLWANFANGAPVLQLFNDANKPGVSITSKGTDNAGEVSLYGAEGNLRIDLAAEGTNNSGQITLRNDVGALKMNLWANKVSGAPVFELYNDANKQGISITSKGTDNGGEIALYDAAGALKIDLSAGAGRITTPSLQITGGSDLSENFNVSERFDLGEPLPGMVVSIDPRRPGELIISGEAYDRKVAGIISGAGGVETGLFMGQKGSEADGAYPIALSGRVYVYVDASYGAVEPGDLLTTSATPGHAMRAMDHEQARGAILGKAMTSLKEGKGLVLVLVSLQ